MAEDSTSAEVIQAWLVSKLSERLGIQSDEIDIRESLEVILDLEGYHVDLAVNGGEPASSS